MRKFGLIGYPLGHSFSRKYFTDKFHNEHITDCLYENFPLTDISLIKELLMNEPDLAGFNVTIPYKTEIIKYLTNISPEANEIGAVNVVKISRSGEKTELSGFNSDITGIRVSLSSYLNKDLKNALVFGTGGSSKAVCFVLRKMGIKVITVSRTRSTDSVSYSDIDSALIRKSGLIVNTTPLGMYPNVETFPEIDYRLLGKDHILFDLVYNPEITAFLRKGSERGCSVISGLKMLQSQAEKSWEIWNDTNL
ncbi:MAG: shikimate dehydrogenase [Bacteroidales bacterium]|nr:shikimate dehydrogenase [Bacteroidales bacterium]